MVQQHVNTPPVSTTSWADKREKKKVTYSSGVAQLPPPPPPRDKNTSAHVEQV